MGGGMESWECGMESWVQWESWESWESWGREPGPKGHDRAGVTNNWDAPTPCRTPCMHGLQAPPTPLKVTAASCQQAPGPMPHAPTLPGRCAGNQVPMGWYVCKPQCVSHVMLDRVSFIFRRSPSGSSCNLNNRERRAAGGHVRLRGVRDERHARRASANKRHYEMSAPGYVTVVDES